MTVPNLVTFVRLLLVPVFVGLFGAGRPASAFWVFLTAAVLDTVDGALARLLRQHSRLGAVLDPLADKLLVLAAIGVLALRGALPWAFVALVLLRDVVVVALALAARLGWLRLDARPSLFGKYASFALFTTLSIRLIEVAFGDATPARWYVGAPGALAAILLIAATAEYLYRALRPAELA